MKIKPRNHELALVMKNDPTRFRTRTIETEMRKVKHSRARRQEGWRKEVRAD